MLLLVASAASLEAADGSFRLALVEDQTYRLSVTLDRPLEHLFKTFPSSGTLLETHVLPCYYSSNDFRFRIPPTLRENDLPEGDIPATALESESEAAVVFPPVKSLVDALAREARDPSSWKEAWSVTLSSRPVKVGVAKTESGETLLSALLKPGEEGATWRSTISTVHEVTWEGKPVSILMVARVYGGPGRLAEALRQERKKGPLIEAARGNLFASFIPELRGARQVEALAKEGLTHSAVSSAELRFWTDLTAYRAAHPDGVRFLSANLVYSSATTTSVFPPFAVVPAQGMKVALVGITPPSASKYLAQAGLSNAAIQEPLEALDRVLPQARKEADAVIVLGEFGDEVDALAQRTRGADAYMSRDDEYNGWTPPPEPAASQEDRPAFHPALLVGRTFSAAMPVLEGRLKLKPRTGTADWSVVERQRLLDDTVEDQPGWPEFDPAIYGITLATGAPLMPSAAQIFGEPLGSSRKLTAREFWTMAAALAADKTKAEAALLRVFPMSVETEGAIPESVARVWTDTEEQAVFVTLAGKELKPLLEEAERQREREAKGLGRAAVRYTAAGYGPEFRVHGSHLRDDLHYRVLTTPVLADALGLSHDHKPRPLKKRVGEIVMDALRAERGSSPERYRDWSAGRPVRERGVWTINFRDIGLNIQQTQVVRGDEFNGVPNSRIQGFNELLIGEELKTDAEWQLQPYRWMNTLELEYARSELHPRDAPAITNTTANRIMFNTTGSRRAGVIKDNWFAREWGPALGLQYDGQFQAAPGLRRRQIYSLLPGVTFNDGSWVHLFEFTGDIKRDLSRDPPNTQTGLHSRLVASHEIGKGPANFQGEFWSNYFFRGRQDTLQDLLFEGDINLKLRVPIRKYLTISPFLDFYFFGLKVMPSKGYSSMLGVQIGFSRLWKPQYEGLLGER